MLLVRFGQQSARHGVADVIAMNIGLCLFNLLPIPPLDGGAILARFVPRRYDHLLDGLDRYGFIILFALLMTGLLSQADVAGAPSSASSGSSTRALVDPGMSDQSESEAPPSGDGSIDYKVELPDFEGPLDLLLHLVQEARARHPRHPDRVHHRSLPAMLDVMRSLNLDVAGEYL